MLQKIEFQIQKVISQNDQFLIESKIDTLKGIKDVKVHVKDKKIEILFDNDLILENEIIKKLEELGYKVRKEFKKKSLIREHCYFVKGMHCSSCEILIEKKLLSFDGIKSVEANASRGEVMIEYIDKRPKIEKLNSIFKKEKYLFFDQPVKEKKSSLWKSLIISLVVITLFLFLNKSGLAGLVNVNLTSSLPVFFLLGLMAGISSCSALVGGLILTMSKQWLSLYGQNQSTFKKYQPHLMFNLGRIISYAVLGTILGAIGSKLQLSLTFSSFLIITVSLVMIVSAFQMLGLNGLLRFRFSLPKFITRYIANESNFKGRYMPFLMGALTFFLPCGFTNTAQGLALLSGNPLQAGLIMFFFALGTAPSLLLISFSVVKFSSRPHWTLQVSKVAGILILFFALYNINSQLNVLGYPSLSNFTFKTPSFTNTENRNLKEKDLAPIVNGKQILKMDASSNGYLPNYFKVKVGVPVKWEITDKGTSGCTNVIISKSLFDGEIPLSPGQISVKEFTPSQPGKYKFSCWMGMVSGIIEVVDNKDSASTLIIDNNIISSGARGCGCGNGENYKIR